MTSPSSSRTNRKTPWAAGCCGPKFIVKFFKRRGRILPPTPSEAALRKLRGAVLWAECCTPPPSGRAGEVKCCQTPEEEDTPEDLSQHRVCLFSVIGFKFSFMICKLSTLRGPSPQRAARAPEAGCVSGLGPSSLPLAPPASPAGLPRPPPTSGASGGQGR
jgi:hypothetical protein